MISAEPPDVQGRVNLLVSLAEQARREGLLALDAQIAEIDDDFTKKGLQLVVDGTDPELVRDILDAEIDGMARPPPRRRRAVREGRRLRADDGDHRHGHGARPRAPEPVRAGDARPLDLARRSSPR